MSYIDALPVLSQVKSLVRVCNGDFKGALETQDNFSRQCPVVSQCRSLVHAVQGDNDQALKVQEEFATGPGLAVLGLTASRMVGLAAPHVPLKPVMTKCSGKLAVAALKTEIKHAAELSKHEHHEVEE